MSKSIKRILKSVSALVLTAALAFSLASCGNMAGDGGNVTDNGGNTSEEEKKIYFLNFKPEVASVYEEIAAKYKAETGVTVKVVTAAANTYEQTLKSEIAKSDAPTIFQVNGAVGYAAWKNYCADLKNTGLYSHLTDKDMALRSGDGVYGIPYVVEGYGIIYNEEITDKYFALPKEERGTEYESMAEIKSFDALSSLVADMTENRGKLGIDGVFASTSLKPGDDWRWHTHLSDLPLYYEWRDNKTEISDGTPKTVEFKYSDNFKKIFDLYTENSVSAKTTLGTKQVTDSMSEFALGKCAMVQNGTWAWSEISGVSGSVVKADKIKMLPIYIGVPGEEKQGLCVGTENYLAINSKASEKKQKLSADFLLWLFSSDTGRGYVTEKLGFVTPFDTFTEEERPKDPLAREMLRYLNNSELYNVNWVFTVYPGQVFKEKFGAALLKYAQGSLEFGAVKDTVISEWKNQAGAGK